MQVTLPLRRQGLQLRRQLHLAGKLGTPGGVHAVRPGKLVFLKDQLSGALFLADTGATVSIIPGPTSSGGQALTAANGGTIATGAERTLQLVFSDSTSRSHRFSFDFIQGQVDGPILGIDFMRQFKMTVDPSAACVRRNDGTVFPGSLSSTLSNVVLSAIPSDIQHLIEEFPDVCTTSKLMPPPATGVKHSLLTEGPPVTARFRRLDSDKLKEARAIFAAWERDGVVRRSSSQWSSPLHMVKKKDGSWRPCGDFRRLNLSTKADKYPVPNLADFSSQLEGCSVFSTLDLKNGYLQVPLEKSAVPKTAVITPFGLFEFLRMPFGLKNAGMTFQRYMDHTFNGLEFVFIYVDDILVASRNRQEHLLHLREIFRRLKQAGLILNLAKCTFSRPSVEFLGHQVCSSGIRPLTAKVEALRRHPKPATVKELQQFLGLLNFYRRFIPGAAKTLAPLTEQLKGAPAGSSKLQWSAAMSTAFDTAKASLSASALLSHPSSSAELVVVADASSSHVGAALHQRRRTSDPWQPLGFFSKKLDRAQVSYSAFDRELLAAFSAIRHFRFQVEGRQFQLWTDHRPLTYALSRCTDAWTPRQQRQLSYIAEYTADIRYVPGVENVVADTLSRPPITDAQPSTAVSSMLPAGDAQQPQAASLFARPPAAVISLQPAGVAQQPQAASLCARPPAAVISLPPDPVLPFTGGGIDVVALAAAQSSCKEVTAMKLLPSLRISSFKLLNIELLCDFSTGTPRPLLPPPFRYPAFAAAHTLSHTGIRATKRLMSSRWVWTGMAADIARWCRDCQHCQRAKVTKQPRAAAQHIPIPARRFSHVHIDLVGPLPRSADGFNHIFTMVDRSSRWLEAVPLSSTDTATIAAAFTSSWIARFGVPDHLTSDRGPQFCSALWSELSQRWGIKHHLTTAYHPQANGMVERAHRQLKDALRARAAGGNWTSHLPWVLLGMRVAPKEDSSLSSAELVYGAPLVTPGQLPGVPEPPPAVFQEAVRVASSHIPGRSPSSPQPPESIPAALADSSFVYIRHGGAKSPLSPAYSGPYAVITRFPKYFILDMGDRQESVSVDRLKPHLGSAIFTPAVAPRRGRPSKSVVAPGKPLGGE